MIGWDLLALGLPAANEPFEQGRFEQQIELPGLWLERGVLDANDPHTPRLLDSPLGWDGHRVLATLWWSSGTTLDAARRDGLIEAARQCIEASALRAHAGVTSPDGRLVVMRALAGRTEPAQALLATVWARWREAGWGLAACPPRVWKT